MYSQGTVVFTARALLCLQPGSVRVHGVVYTAKVLYCAQPRCGRLQ